MITLGWYPIFPHPAHDLDTEDSDTHILWAERYVYPSYQALSAHGVAIRWGQPAISDGRYPLAVVGPYKS